LIVAGLTVCPRTRKQLAPAGSTIGTRRCDAIKSGAPRDRGGAERSAPRRAGLRYAKLCQLKRDELEPCGIKPRPAYSDNFLFEGCSACDLAARTTAQRSTRDTERDKSRDPIIGGGSIHRLPNITHFCGTIEAVHRGSAIHQSDSPVLRAKLNRAHVEKENLFPAHEDGMTARTYFFGKAPQPIKQARLEGQQNMAPTGNL
jgi:hypothetical protein